MSSVDLLQGWSRRPGSLVSVLWFNRSHFERPPFSPSTTTSKGRSSLLIPFLNSKGSLTQHYLVQIPCSLVTRQKSCCCFLTHFQNIQKQPATYFLLARHEKTTLSPTKSCVLLTRPICPPQLQNPNWFDWYLATRVSLKYRFKLSTFWFLIFKVIFSIFHLYSRFFNRFRVWKIGWVISTMNLLLCKQGQHVVYNEVWWALLL